MTMSQFETLRSELAPFRAQVTAELATLGAQIDEKPSAATIYQAALTVSGGMFAAIIGTEILLKTIGTIP